MGLVQRFGPFTQTPVATWAASTSQRVNLDRLGLITRIVFTAEITPSATIKAATSSPGGLYRVMRNHRVMAGNKAFFEIPNTGESGNGGQLLHAMNVMDFHGMPGFPDGETVSGPDRTYRLPAAHKRFGRTAYGPERAPTEIVGYCNRRDDEQAPDSDSEQCRRYERHHD